MFEVRFHGRGGQGSVTAAELLAMAAFKDGKYSQAFPIFGVERRGAPVQAFCRMDDKPIKLRSQVYNPDMVVIQDASLLSNSNILNGIKQNGSIIINTSKTPYELRIKQNGSIIINTSKTPYELNINTYNIKTVDATGLAFEIIGKPIVNTIMLGAIARMGVVSLEGVIESIKEKFNGRVRKLNIQAVKRAYSVV
jgi:pyruvate ferredoxin oxidoreductase gamma subunit